MREYQKEIMSSHNLITLPLGALDVVGYSVAGEETAIAVPGLDVCFDIGKAPEQLLSINNLLVTHSHMDHVAGIAYYCSQRDFRDMAAATVLIPKRLAPMLDELLDFWGRFDGTRPPVNIIPVEHDSEIELRRNLYAVPFKTYHTKDSLGYTIIDRRYKLKDEYLQYPGHEIAKMRKEGVAITNVQDVPLVSCVGDTGVGDFMKLDRVNQSEILITECTFFEEDHHSRAKAGKHLHIDQLVKWLENVTAKHIVLVRLSRRTHIGQARKMLRKSLSKNIYERISILMHKQPAPKV